MDSLSQLALGSVIGVAVMGRRTAVWKAALWGGIAGTLPDLDALIDYGDPLRNMTLHRAESHSLFYLTLFSPALALAASKLHGQLLYFKRWWLALWLALVTHPCLDWMTVYGTQLGIPFVNTPFGLGSIFIIDPIYTLPLLVGVAAALIARSDRGLAWNRWGLSLSCAYLLWTAGAQWRVEQIAERSLAQAGIEARQTLATPSPFNTVLWRIVAMTSDGYVEGFYSFLDDDTEIRFNQHNSGRMLVPELAHIPGVERMRWFTRGFYSLSERDGRALVTDLRMGQEPNYVFAFAVGQRGSGFIEHTPIAVGQRGDIGRGLAWVWQRLLGNDVPPPR
ncbi:MAG TPA: metal-dependent hydrolase [Rhodocyclaceae bacterium]